MISINQPPLKNKPNAPGPQTMLFNPGYPFQRNLMKLLSLIPHWHHWQDVVIIRANAVAPNGRSYFSTHITARCRSCDQTLHRVYYRDISDAQARRWLG